MSIQLNKLEKSKKNKYISATIIKLKIIYFGKIFYFKNW